MTSITAGTSSIVSELRQLDSRNVRLQRLSGEEVQDVLAEIRTLKETSGIRAPQLAEQTAAAPPSPEQIAGAVVTAETGLRAQQIAQEDVTPETAALAEQEENGESEAVKAFLDYMAKTPEERYFETFLKSKGMTQEEYDALPVEDKKALMKEFEEFVKQSMENNSAEKVARTSRSELL